MTSFAEKTPVVEDKTGLRTQDAPAYEQTPVVETYSANSEPVTASPAPPPTRQKFWHYFSPEDTPAERRLILKLDGLIMVFLFLAYWGKVLDSSATGTAYVSGMKEDLMMFGNELNYLNTVYL